MMTQVPEELMDQVLSVLDAADDKSLSLKAGIYDAALTYMCMKRLVPPLAPAKAQKAKIKQMGHLAHKLLNVSKEIQGDYFCTLDYAVEIADPEDASFRKLMDMQADVERMRKGCELFVKMFRPTKGSRTNILLQEAVRELIGYIRDMAGIEVKIASNKHETGEPSFASNGSKAVGTLLRGIDSKLSNTAIANMIDKVSRGQLSADPLDDLMDVYCAPLPTCK